MNDTRTDPAIAAALERNDAFLRLLVEGENVCPFARPARLNGQTRRAVVLERVSDDAPLRLCDALRAAHEEIARDPGVEVTQVIFPNAALAPAAWVRQVKDVTERAARGGRSTVASAAFHPELPFRADTAAGLVPLFRRSPDPMIQWIRLDALDRVRAGRPDGDVAMPSDAAAQLLLLEMGARAPLGDEIAAANFRRARRLGVDALVGQLAALRTGR